MCIRDSAQAAEVFHHAYHTAETAEALIEQIILQFAVLNVSLSLIHIYGPQDLPRRCELVQGARQAGVVVVTHRALCLPRLQPARLHQAGHIAGGCDDLGLRRAAPLRPALFQLSLIHI